MLDLIKVALIDDDEDDFQLIKELLDSIPNAKYDLRWFSTSASGLEALKIDTFDIYLVDYRIDSRTGLDLLEESQKHGFKKIIILLTGIGDHRVDLSAMEKGASDFLTKDQLTSEQLERSIRYSIKRAQDQARIQEADKLRSDKEASEAANRAKSIFLANMSHEIRTPLSAIIGFNDLLLESDHNGEEQKNFLKLVKKNGEHLLSLINDILDLSKVEAGQLKVDQDSFDWTDLVANVIKILSSKSNEKSLNVIFEKSPDLPPILISDANRMRQILINLLGNAIKFTEVGKILVKAWHAEQNGKPMLLIDVTDTGPGLSKEDQLQLFKPFQQGNSSLSRRHGGTGLGLNLSRKLAVALGGDLLLASSQIGIGSTFRLALPGNLRAATKPEANEASSKGATAPSQTTRVLLVEDTKEIQIIVKYFLKNSCFQLECADDGAMAMRMITSGNYDIILMDIQMPIMDGLETTRQLRNLGFKKPIIALTAHALRQDREQALLRGFSDYLTKPINKKELLDALTRFSEQRFKETTEKLISGSPWQGSSPNPRID